MCRLVDNGESLLKLHLNRSLHYSTEIIKPCIVWCHLLELKSTQPGNPCYNSNVKSSFHNDLKDYSRKLNFES